MDISIVVCTRNRAARLAEAFSHYRRLQSALAWEAIFVNNGSTDATAEVLAGFARELPERVTVLDEAAAGVSAGRNTGWRNARGNVVAFLDDDCYPAPDYVEQLHRCFGEAALGFLGGRILLFDRKDYPITIQPLERRIAVPPRTFIRMGLLHGANIAFRREVLESIGGFDVRLGPGTAVLGGEDQDVLARASAHGYRGAYDPGPTVYHHHRRSRPEDVRRLMASYDVARGAYFAKEVMDPVLRRSYLWPVVRKIGGNLWRGEFGVMWREFYGAWKYVVH